MLSAKKLTPDQALIKIKSFCAYQERCHSEVKDKLYSYGLNKSDAEHIICTLIDENYLNEERFASQFAGGKFRVKHWGKEKIKHALIQKKVSAYCIKSALQQINETEYSGYLKKLTMEKSETLTGNENRRKVKLYTYLVQKGYEQALVQEVVGELFNRK